MPSTSRNQLLHALRRVLRPIVRVLIRAGIRFDEFAELARGVFVETAIRDGLDNVAVPTRARVSVVTGVSRQQVDYYIDNKGAIPSAKPTLASIMVEVLQKWHTEPQYVGPYGIPLELEFEVDSGGRCFRALVGLVNQTVSPGIVLEELLRVGSVMYSGETHYRAVSRYFMMPEPMSPQQIEYFGSALTRLAQTLEFNMDPKNPNKRLERFVLADRGLPADVVPKFEQYARERATEFLVDLDNWLTPYSASASVGDSARIASGLNIFLYIEPAADTGALADLVKPTPDPR
jgi:Family of unknown function (DUF6502)